jgi:hypothetical protein
MRAFLDGEAAGQAVALQKVTGASWFCISTYVSLVGVAVHEHDGYVRVDGWNTIATNTHGLRWSVDVDLPRLRSLHDSSCQRGGTHQIARIFFLLSSLFSNENEKSGLAGAASILSIPDVHSQRASKG